ncbi:MAG: hypothetical protein WAT71_07135 [Ignavibacteria bacterium]
MKKLFTVLILVFLNVGSNAQINSFPYVETGDNPVGWNAVQGIPIWSLGTSTVNPAGLVNDAALICNFFAYSPGPDGLIISPIMDFTNLTHPIVHFYVAYASYNDNNDSMQFLVSTDFGNTFVDLPVAYRKSFNQSPSYATVPSQETAYSPNSTYHWRHETIDLSAFAGQNYLLFAYRGVCAYGNNLFIDNFIAENADDYSSAIINSPGTYVLNELSFNFNSIGQPAAVKVLENDNAGGGFLQVTEHIDQVPVPSLASPQIKPNTTATTGNGSVFTPDFIATDNWFTVSYTGDDLNGDANYDITIDLSSFGSVSDPARLYIVKRSDYTSSWECLNTVVTGNSLKASGLTSFSDFGVASSTSLKLALKFYLEGFYDGTIMNADTVKVNLRSQTSPYAIVDNSKTLLNFLGEGTLDFPNAISGTCYYFEVIHRNHTRVFSHSTCEQMNNPVTPYDFTNSVSKTYGNNSVFVAGPNAGYASYTADINQDGLVDLSDYSVINNDAFNFYSGYIPSDVNGDGVTELSDLTYCDNNTFNFISAIVP